MHHRSTGPVIPLHPPQLLPFSGDEEADRLLASEPLALLIGFALDQQVPLQKAFSGPLELQRRIGPYDARRLARMDPAELEAAFVARPALHRFPANMARRVRQLAAALVRDYGGEPARIWTEAIDGPQLKARLLALPGFGEMKAGTIVSLLAHQYGLDLPELDAVLPHHPTLGDVDSYEARNRYQTGKRASKASLRAAADAPESARPGH